MFTCPHRMITDLEILKARVLLNHREPLRSLEYSLKFFPSYRLLSKSITAYRVLALAVG
jgi:hypothetical protein